MSLDACAVAGNTFASFSPSFSLPPPPPSFLARGVFTSKLGFCNRFLNEVWTVIGLSPFTWFPFHPPPQTFFSLLFFHVLLSSCLFILILSFSCAHYRPDLSLYTYTHAYSTYSKVQVAQVRYNEVWLIGCPSSRGSFSSVPFACTCAHLLSGQDGGVCVCNPWNHRDPFGLFCLGFLLWILQQGTQHFTGTVSNEATSEVGYPAWPAGRTCNFPFPNGMRLSLEPPDMTCTLRRHLVGSSFVFLFLATSRIQWFVLVPLGIGTLGRRVAPLSSQYAYP